MAASSSEIVPLSSKDDVALYQQGLRYQDEKDYNKASNYFYHSAILNSKKQDGSIAAFTTLKTLYETEKPDEYVSNRLGVCYNHGFSTEINVSKALSCFQYAAKLGSPVAMVNCGLYYELGKGVPVDLAKAAQYYLDALCVDDTDKDGSRRGKNRLNTLARKKPFTGLSPMSIAVKIKHKAGIKFLFLKQPQAHFTLIMKQGMLDDVLNDLLRIHFFKTIRKAIDTLSDENKALVKARLLIIDPTFMLRLANETHDKTALSEVLSADSINSVSLYNGWTPLWYAIVNGLNDIALKLITTGASLRLRTNNDETVMMIAAKNNNDGAIDLLMQYGFTELEAQNNLYETALHLAAAKGHVEAVNKLLHYGADINAVTLSKQTPTHLAIVNKRLPVLKVLLTQDPMPDLSMQNVEGYPPMLLAVKNSFVDAFMLIASYIAVDVISIRDNNGNTALHLAVINGNKDAVIMFLKHGIDVNVPNKDFDTALHLALRHKQNDIAKLLISHDANLWVENAAKETPLGYQEDERYPVAKLIFTQIKNLNSKFLWDLGIEIKRLQESSDALSHKKVLAWQGLKERVEKNMAQPYSYHIAHWRTQGSPTHENLISLSKAVLKIRPATSFLVLEGMVASINAAGFEYQAFTPRVTIMPPVASSSSASSSSSAVPASAPSFFQQTNTATNAGSSSASANRCDL